MTAERKISKEQSFAQNICINSLFFANIHCSIRRKEKRSKYSCQCEAAGYPKLPYRNGRTVGFLGKLFLYTAFVMLHR